MTRLFTHTNGDNENVLLLDYTSQWTISGNQDMYVIGDKRIGGYEITGDAVDRFVELERSAPRWISVKDKLPIKEGDYLCYYPNGHITIRHCYAYDPFGFAASGFTHWMELPAPPAD